MHKKNILVLVVGARTTGLTMACELARRGIAVRIIDKSPGIDPHSRACYLHSRSLEIFQDLGILEQVLAESQEYTSLRRYANGKEYNPTTFGDVESPYPWAIGIGQYRTEAHLENLLNKFGVEIERNTELIHFKEDTDIIHGTIRHQDGHIEKFATQWLIGCDGAHSRVRHINGFAFPGQEDPYLYVQADVQIDPPLAKGEGAHFLTDQGVLIILPIPENRVLLGADLTEQHTLGETPRLEKIQSLVSERGPANTRVYNPRWLTYYRIHYRLTQHYRKGRSLMAGDAVHVHSPIGGQGMNTGIQDAYNLAWKLALVIQGDASDSLLDTYETERRKVAEDVLNSTRMITERIEMFAHLSQAEREKLYINVMIPEPERLAAARQREELNLDYRNSPICCEDASTSVADTGFNAGPHPGAQAPDVEALYCNGRLLSLFEILKGTQHTLLLFAGPANNKQTPQLLTSMAEFCANHYASLITIYIVCSGSNAAEQLAPTISALHDSNKKLHHRYAADTTCLYLIRPDGYIAYRQRPLNQDLFQRYLAKVFVDNTR